MIGQEEISSNSSPFETMQYIGLELSNVLTEAETGVYQLNYLEENSKDDQIQLISRYTLRREENIKRIALRFEDLHNLNPIQPAVRLTFTLPYPDAARELCISEIIIPAETKIEKRIPGLGTLKYVITNSRGESHIEGDIALRVWFEDGKSYLPLTPTGQRNKLEIKVNEMGNKVDIDQSIILFEAVEEVKSLVTAFRRLFYIA